LNVMELLRGHVQFLGYEVRVPIRVKGKQEK
jgi:hypothetical protein